MKKMTTYAVVCAAALVATGMVASAEETYNVGVCQLVQHPALDAATEGFVDALTDALGDGVEVTVENAAGDPATCSSIANQFVQDEVDLIMANATPALQAAMAITNEIPILGTSITDYATALDMADWTGVTGTNISGTSDLAPLSEQAAMLKELFPEAETVGILYCSAEANSKYQATVITEELAALGYENIKEYQFADTNDVMSVTKTACDECDVLYIPTDNTAASCAATVRDVAVPAGVPIIAGEEGICGGCGVATLSISYYDLGYTTGEMAAKILADGEDISAMEIEYAPNVEKKYNAEICEELGVEVPEGYVAIEVAEEE